MDIAALCLQMAEWQASDLFLSVGRIPSMRRAGEIAPTPGGTVLTDSDVEAFLSDHLPSGTAERLAQKLDLDLGVALGDGGRFRINLSYQRGRRSLAIRRIPSGALDYRKLLIPETVIRLADSLRGMIVVTGATGTGKTTTLACMLHYINTTMRKHVVTIEDPIEFTHEDQMAVISQREIGGDTRDFASALRHVVRQNPDIIFIGEMRDRETVQMAVSAAMTGHLVAATMHTVDVQQTVERILNYFPEDVRDQTAQDLSLVLRGIVSQRLLPRRDGQGRAPAFEIMVQTPLAQRLIAGRELDALPEVIRAGGNQGMISFNRSLLELYQQGIVSLEIAANAASHKDEFLLLAQGMETGIDTLRSYSGDPDQGLSIKKLLRDAIGYGASDLILTVDSPPVIRLDGALRSFDMPVLTAADTQKLLFSVLTFSQRADFESGRELDFALSVKGLEVKGGKDDYRFRVNGFYQKSNVAAAFRVIPSVIPSPESLGLPAALLRLTRRQQGLVLVTGPTGSGKSTTLAALLNVINRTRPCHIITIEDPIEFVHPHQVALVEQREIGSDTLSFANALKYVLRQDPDVILVGEMRDPETIATVLTAAETGHLVFATLHTNDVTQSVDRIIDVFPSERQNQVRSQLAACLEAIVSQRLMLRKGDQGGRIAAFEVLIGTTAVRAMIREKKTHQLKGMMETSAKDGMVTMERALRDLFEAGKITRETMLSMTPL
ncbi:MAG: PilT/PilU family type 4a pilus ATPase [Lentisphaerae bacterium]|mgnify:FL=1|jgi:twitching motility protein PilT|nr:PilT/PilU family type 4a pilus ATPase [Lentisphaerota bacterium]